MIAEFTLNLRESRVFRSVLSRRTATFVGKIDGILCGDSVHDLPDSPKFRWNHGRLVSTLAAVRHEQGRLIGRMEALGFSLQQEAVLQTLTVKSSEIEGERLDAVQVRSSIARRLGMGAGGVDVVDRRGRRCRRDDGRRDSKVRPRVDEGAAIRLARPGAGRSTSYSLAEIRG